MSCVKHQTTCASGGIGRLAGFRCQCSQGRAGSTPASRTRQAPASKRSWGLRFARKPWGAMTEGTASLPCLFLIFYTNAQKKARKYHIRQSNITREVTQYAGLPPRCSLGSSFFRFCCGESCGEGVCRFRYVSVHVVLLPMPFLRMCAHTGYRQPLGWTCRIFWELCFQKQAVCGRMIQMPRWNYSIISITSFSKYDSK